jgi:hypothetical protein
LALGRYCYKIAEAAGTGNKVCGTRNTPEKIGKNFNPENTCGELWVMFKLFKIERLQSYNQVRNIARFLAKNEFHKNKFSLAKNGAIFVAVLEIFFNTCLLQKVTKMEKRFKNR